MAKPHKQFSEELMNKSLDAAMDAFSACAESGPVKKTDGNYQFETMIHRQRGTPKLFRITVEEIH